jgi:hypothetical protein
MKNKELKKQIMIVVDYLWKDEKRHYQETEKPKADHIFLNLKAIKKELKNIKK